MNHVLLLIVSRLICIYVAVFLPTFSILDANHFFSNSTHAYANSSYPLIAITAYYDDSRLQYLLQVLNSLSNFPKAHIVIFTNSVTDEQRLNLENVCTKALSHRSLNIGWEIRKCAVEPNGYCLTWQHKPMIADEFVNSEIYTHFIYLEDDEELTLDNFLYFVEFREKLRDRGLLPALIRVEYHKGLNEYTATDQMGPICI